MNFDGDFSVISSLDRNDIYQVSRTIERLISKKIDRENDKIREQAEKEVDLLLKDDNYYQKLILTIASLEETIDLLNKTIQPIIESFEKETSHSRYYSNIELHWSFKNLAKDYKEYKVDALVRPKLLKAIVPYLDDVIAADMTLINSAVPHPSFPASIDKLVEHYWDKYVTTVENSTTDDIVPEPLEEDWDDEYWVDEED
jgi:hypothetical protein